MKRLLVASLVMMILNSGGVASTQEQAHRRGAGAIPEYAANTAAPSHRMSAEIEKRTVREPRFPERRPEEIIPDICVGCGTP